MAYLACNVEKGLRENDVTVEVTDIDHKSFFLGVQKSFLRGDSNSNRRLLPIGVVYQDKDSARALIELPLESDSGINRLWVALNALQF